MEYHIYMKLTIQIINKYMQDLALPPCTNFSIFQRKIMYSPEDTMTIINNYSKIVDTTTEQLHRCILQKTLACSSLLCRLLNHFLYIYHIQYRDNENCLNRQLHHCMDTKDWIHVDQPTGLPRCKSGCDYTMA